MNMIYNSPNYCVVEFATSGVSETGTDTGGFEIMDKHAKREIYLAGSLADGFRRGVAELIASEPTIEEVDEFLSQFNPLMQQPMTLH
ncbi:MAG: DUF3567 domain-containing protein [Burkholderiaceae bacterium]|jgi:hypothetical protein